METVTSNQEEGSILELLKAKLDRHVEMVTALQEQILKEEREIFACFARERELLSVQKH